MRRKMLVISIVLGLLPLAGVAKILLDGEIKLLAATMDGLFMALILLAMSGIFFLNALLEAREAGWLKFLKREKTGAGKTE